MVADIQFSSRQHASPLEQGLRHQNDFSYDPLVLQAAQQLINIYKSTKTIVKLEAFDLPHEALLSMSTQLEHFGLRHKISAAFTGALKDYVMSRGGNFARTANATPVYITIEVADRRPDFRFEDGVTEMAALDEFKGQMQGVSHVQMYTTISGTKMTSNQVDVDNMFLFTKGLKLWVRFEAPTKSELDGVMTEQEVGLTAAAESLGGIATAEQLEEILDQLSQEGEITPEVSSLLEDMIELKALVEEGITPDSEVKIKALSEKITAQIEAGIRQGTLPPLIANIASQTLINVAQKHSLSHLIDIPKLEVLTAQSITAFSVMAGAADGPLMDTASQLAAEILDINPALDMAQMTQILADNSKIAIIAENDPEFAQILEDAGLSESEISQIIRDLKNPASAEAVLAQMKIAEEVPKIAILLSKHDVTLMPPKPMQIAMALGVSPAQVETDMASSADSLAVVEALEITKQFSDKPAALASNEKAEIAQTVSSVVESDGLSQVQKARVEQVAQKIEQGQTLTQKDVEIIKRATQVTPSKPDAQHSVVSTARSVFTAAAGEVGTIAQAARQAAVVTPTATTTVEASNVTPMTPDQASPVASAPEISLVESPASQTVTQSAVEQPAGETSAGEAPTFVETVQASATNDNGEGEQPTPLSPEQAMVETPPKTQDAPQTSQPKADKDATAAKMDYKATAVEAEGVESAPETQIAEKPQGCGGCGICATCRGADVDQSAKVANDANDFMAGLDTEGVDTKSEQQAQATTAKMDYKATAVEAEGVESAPETQIAEKPQGCGGCGICATCRGADVDQSAKVANDANDFMAGLDAGEKEGGPQAKAPTPAPVPA